MWCGCYLRNVILSVKENHASSSVRDLCNLIKIEENFMFGLHDKLFS